MDFGLSEEQQAVRDVARSAVARWSAEGVSDTDTDQGGQRTAELWEAVAAGAGLPGLLVPERLGGAGLGFRELSLAIEEIGSELSFSPLLVTSALATALLNACDENAGPEVDPGPGPDHWRLEIDAARSVAAVVFAQDEAADPLRAVSMHTRDGRWCVNGTATHVINGSTASIIVGLAAFQDDFAVFGVEAPSPGLTRTPLQTPDPTREIATVTFDDVIVRRVNVSRSGRELLDHLTAVAAVLLAAEDIGGARRCLDMAVDYAKTRVQFGRPIGSFQAVKHRCAEALLAVEAGVAAARYASWAADENPPELGRASAMARACCSAAFLRAAEANVQIHGGIGFTWEHPAHLYLKRARTSAVLAGGPTSLAAHPDFVTWTNHERNDLGTGGRRETGAVY